MGIPSEILPHLLAYNKHLIYFTVTEQGGNAFDLYLGGAWFKPLPGTD
jgi:hypothetical protein